MLTTFSKCLQKIAEGIVLTSDAPSEVDVKFSSSCRKSTVPGGCDDVHVGDVVDYTATIEARECLPDGKYIMSIHPKTMNQNITIELETLCECPCSLKNSLSYQNSSEVCNKKGDLVCGVCKCDTGRLGKNCECNGTNPYNIKTDCIMEGTDAICSGERIVLTSN